MNVVCLSFLIKIFLIISTIKHNNSNKLTTLKKGVNLSSPYVLKRLALIGKLMKEIGLTPAEMRKMNKASSDDEVSSKDMEGLLGGLGKKKSKDDDEEQLDMGSSGKESKKSEGLLSYLNGPHTDKSVLNYTPGMNPNRGIFESNVKSGRVIAEGNEQNGSFHIGGMPNHTSSINSHLPMI